MSTIVITKQTNGLKVKEGSRKAYTLVGKPDSITPRTDVVSIWINKTEYLFSISDTITFDGVPFSGTEEDLADSFRTAFNLNSTSVTSNVNGQATMANSAPVAIASNQSTLNVQQPAVTASGNITTQNLVAAGAATANSAVEVSTNGASTLAIQVTGTYTGALSLQGTIDGTTWVTSGIYLLYVTTGGYAATITSAANGIYWANVAGFVKVRITALAAVTGTAVVSLAAVSSAAMNGAVAPFPAGSQVIGNVGLTPNNSLGFSSYHTLVAAATTNATSVKGSNGIIGMITVHNKSAGVIYLKIFNKATAPTVGTDTPVFNFGIPAASQASINLPGMGGMRMSTGIAYALTGGQALLDATALAAGDAVVNINYF
jgi:hypothetical protein